MAKIDFPKYYTLYETGYGSDQPYQQLYVIMFGALPSRFCPLLDFNENVLNFFLNLNFTELIRNETFKRGSLNKIMDVKEFFKKMNTSFMNEDRLLVNYEKKILIRLNIKKEDNQNRITVEFLYDIKNGPIFNQINFEDVSSHFIEKRKSNITLIKSDMGHLDTEEFELSIPEINLELNYGKDFIKIHDLIIKRLNTNNDKGIILLHGDPGTGKTSYIKYLTKCVTEKEILFIPPSMAEILSEPSIIPFLMEHKNSILVIEDAERVISDRESNGSSTGVSNILNLTDGILGDCLGIQIIATFNMKKEKIDSALLRKGRLIVEHKFKYLSVSDTNTLLKNLGKNYISEEEMSLSDIYNIDVESYKVENKTNKIGFI